MKTFPSFLLLFICLNISNGQLVLERDINQEPASSNPSYFAELDGALYFEANDGINGEELYKYDLTTETAELVANLNPYEDNAAIQQVIAFDNKIYFIARDGLGIDHFLFVHDPSDGSTQRLSDSQNNDAREPAHLFEYNGQLFFGAELNNNDVELYRYDPVINEVILVQDINPNSGSNPNSFVVYNGELYFSANDGSSDSKLWKYDSATDMVENIVYDSPNNIYPSFSQIYLFEDKLFTPHFVQGKGDELYIYDFATNAILDLPEIYVGAGSSSPSLFQELEGKLYFSARTITNGRELRVYDPISNTVTLAADIFPGSDNSSPGELFVIDNKLYFTANVSLQERKLFSFSSNSGLMEEASLPNDGSNNYLSSLYATQGSLFLSGETNEYGRELFQFTPGNNTIELAADINLLTIGSDPYGFTAYNGKLYFGATEVNSGREIWVYNPATGTVDILSDSPISIKPDMFTVLDGKLYFSGIDPVEGYGILVYDDVTNLITPTSFITPNSTGHISDMIAFNGKIYFSADTDDFGSELYVYDPGTDTWDITQDIVPNGDSYAEDLIIFQNQLFFVATDGVNGRELWNYDDVTGLATMVADINPGADDSSPEAMQEYANELYFSAYGENTNREIFSINPSTGVFTQRTSSSGNLNPRYLTVYKEKLFFQGTFSSSVNSELVFYDVAVDTLILTEDLNPDGNSTPQYLAVFNDKLYFSSFTNDYGRELWEYNDTSLSIVADIRPGVPDSDPEFMTLFNGKLYFAADDGLRGTEIWSIAECLNIFVDTEPQIDPDGFGSIDLTIQGGTPPYTINWSTGATTEDIDMLQQGTYTATIADAAGCLSEISAEVTFLSKNENILSEELVGIFPNPNNGNFSVQVENLDIQQVDIFDLQGRLIYQKLEKGNKNLIDIQLRYVHEGIYFLSIKTPVGIISKKIRVE